MTKLLLVEDEPGIADELTAALRSRGYEVEHAADGPTGLDLARTRRWDVMIVDRLLPGFDGLSLLRSLRCEQIRTPTLVLSALGAIDDRVLGLRAGGDDYLVKPFAIVELTARLEALLRRPTNPRESVLRVGPLELDLVAHRAWRGARELDLLMREFKLLEYLVRHEGQLVTRAMLLEEVWNYRFIPKTNLVDVHMGRLRRKLDHEEEPPLISSVRGMGFVLVAPG